MARTHAVDWDDTLVDATTQEWQPGAIEALGRWLTAGDKVIVHTCRANWPEGRQQIADQLRAARLDHPSVSIVGKPQADDYIDNLAVRHTGDWAETERNVTAGASPAPRVPTLRTARFTAGRTTLDAVGGPKARLTFETRR